MRSFTLSLITSAAGSMMSSIISLTTGIPPSGCATTATRCRSRYGDAGPAKRSVAGPRPQTWLDGDGWRLRRGCTWFAAPVVEPLNHKEEDRRQEDAAKGHAQHAGEDRRSQRSPH